MTVRNWSDGLGPDRLSAAVSDPARVAAVRATGLMDTGPEESFDDLAELAATVTGCRRAFITLVDDRRSFWKSCVGVDVREIGARQRPLRDGFCARVVGSGEPFTVSDAARDPRTTGHPALAAMAIGAWAGCPLVAPGGEVLGTLHVIDDNPHPWQPSELANLATLARAVSTEIDLRRSLARSEASLRTSAAVAQDLRDSLLPPALPQVPGVEAAASYLAAGGEATVVGDFYDLYRAREPWWCAVMGDVCGKGVEAAKITALARYTLRADAMRTTSPAEVLGRLNTALLTQTSTERFITAVFASFRTSSEGIAGWLCTAGHPQPLVLRACGGAEPVGRTGTLLGVLDEVSLVDVSFRLAPGDAVLFYTDGATEARARPTPAATPRPLFGDEALAEALAECRGLTAAAIVERVGRAIALHSGDWASDDTALLVLRVPPRT